MYAGHCASAWVVLSLKRSMPCKGFGCGTGYTRYAGYAFCLTRTGEVLLKDGAVVVLFLVHRRVYGEALGGFPHLFVTDGSGGHRFQRINPVVTHTVGELFLLTPRNTFGQHVRKGVANHFLFNLPARTHLYGRIQPHGYIQKLFVEEGHASFHAPCGEALVGAQAVVEIQFGELAHRFLMESLWRGRFVKYR